ncbi:beta-galactosidase, partial [Sarracenia purpurea var. burkii]
RGHNLPWKLKLRTSKEVKKKVYVCPEPTCVHHDPSRALGDLTGIKKHFSRKHCEKKWKCEKCSKRYAVQSDWKAHSKICGTREYRCDCGTLFSRRDSFITHRAFCDALAEESARTITGANPLLSLQPGASTSPTPHFNLQNQLHNHSLLSSFPLKSEENQPPQSTTLIRPDLPAWLASQPVVEVGDRPDSAPPIDLSTQVFSSPSIPSFQPIASPHMSATALLQKAALMGVTMTKLKNPSETISRPHQAHTGVKANIGTTGLFSSESLAESTAGSGGLVLSSREERESGFVQSFSSPFGEKAVVTSGCMEQVDATLGTGSASDLLLLNNNNSINMMCSSLPCGSGFDGSSAISFEEALNGMLNPRMDSSFPEALTKPATETRWRRSNIEGGGGAGGNDDLTRDFLGLKALSHGGFPNIAAGFDQINSSSSYQQYQNQSPWQG